MKKLIPFFALPLLLFALADQAFSDPGHTIILDPITGPLSNPIIIFGTVPGAVGDPSPHVALVESDIDGWVGGCDVVEERFGCVLLELTPGFHTLTVTTDPPPEASVEIDIFVLGVSPEAALFSIYSDISELEDEGKISSKNGDKLRKFLDDAVKFLQSGKDQQALNKLDIFISKVEKMIEKNDISFDDGNNLIERIKIIQNLI